MKTKTNRTLRKILSIALCLALVMSCAPILSFSVSAEEIVITEGQSLAVYGDISVTLKFIPESDGEYTLKSDSGSDPYVNLYDADMEHLIGADDTDFGLDFVLTYTYTAGEVYYFVLSDYEGTIDYYVLLTKAHEHQGGEATCRGKVCTICGEYYGEADLTKHQGGTPTCRGQQCELCYTYYGEIDEDNHEIVAPPTCQGEYCHLCDEYIIGEVDPDNHVWDNGTCICGAVCEEHIWENGSCSICLADHDHQEFDDDGKCTVCGYQYYSVVVIQDTAKEYYCDLYEAVDNAPEGSTIKLIDNCGTWGDDIYFEKSVTLDLNGRMIDCVSSENLVFNANVTIEDSVGTGVCEYIDLEFNTLCTINGGRFNSYLSFNAEGTTAEDYLGENKYFYSLGEVCATEPVDASEATNLTYVKVASSSGCDYENGICIYCGNLDVPELNSENYYEIDNAGKLLWFAQQVNDEGDADACAKLTADIYLKGISWTPIGGIYGNSFCGVFDGDGHIIRDLSVDGYDHGLGFFGKVSNGTVKNFTIYGDVFVNTEVNYVGGVIGSACGVDGETDGEQRNGAIIQNVTSYVNLNVYEHSVGMIGGFVGHANHESLFENCSWYGTFGAGEYRVDNGAGGFIGKIQENTGKVTIRNCGAYGTIRTNYEMGSYIADDIDSNTIYIGGFIGVSNTDTSIENCLFAGEFERGENLTDEAQLSAFGTLKSVNAIKNCYYLGDDGLAAVHSDSPLKPGDNIEITSVTKARLASGEVAYLLGEAWGQKSNIGGSFPVPADNELYKVVTVGETGNYSVANVGDTNGDGTVDINDYQAMVNTVASGGHTQSETASYDDIIKYDLNGDGYVDALDAALMHNVIGGKKTVDVYAVGDFDIDGNVYEEIDVLSMAEAIKNPEALTTYEKYVCDLNADGKVSYDDLNTLTSMFPYYFVGEE